MRSEELILHILVLYMIVQVTKSKAIHAESGKQDNEYKIHEKGQGQMK